MLSAGTMERVSGPVTVFAPPPEPNPLSKQGAVMQHNISDSETWLPVPGHEGRAEVSSLGRVYSLPRVEMRRNGRKLTLQGRFRKLALSTHGYPFVDLYIGGKAHRFDVHRLVMLAFVGPCPEGMEVLHINGDRKDCRLENLRYGTRGENMLDTVRHGTNAMRNRTNCPRGHALESPNLVPSMLKQGKRTCLACSRAQSHIKYHSHLKGEFQSISDSYHKQIVEDING